MIVLDTNVLSALMRREPEEKVVAWLDRQPRPSIWTTSVTVLEVLYGLKILPEGKRRSALVQAFLGALGKMEQRVLAFDSAAAEQAAELMTARHKRGRPGDLRDTMIAGIVLAQNATLATHNTAYFADLAVAVVDPWNA